VVIEKGFGAKVTTNFLKPTVLGFFLAQYLQYNRLWFRHLLDRTKVGFSFHGFENVALSFTLDMSKRLIKITSKTVNGHLIFWKIHINLQQESIYLDLTKVYGERVGCVGTLILQYDELSTKYLFCQHAKQCNLL